MAGQLNVYNLGSRGVVVDKSKVHSEDGELLQAQNAQTDPAGLKGAIRKRDGIAKLNSSGLAGQVTGMIGLPLPDEGGKTTYFYIALETTTDTWKKYDGATVTTLTSPTRMATLTHEAYVASYGSSSHGQAIALMPDGKLYYPGDDFTPGTTNPTIRSWDGTNEALITRVPTDPNDAANTPPTLIGSMIPYSPTELVFPVSTVFGGDAHTRVFLMDINTGQLTQIGQETDLGSVGADSAGVGDFYTVNGITLWQGEVWIGGLNGGGAAAPHIYHARVGDVTWTQDSGNSAATASGYVQGMATFKDNLYVGLAVDVGGSGKIRKRTTAGVWSTVLTNATAGAFNYAGPFVVTLDGGTILAFQQDGATALAILKSTDGSSWSVDYDILGGALGNTYTRSGQPVMDPLTGTIYWPISGGAAGAGNGALLKRTNAGTWSVVFSAAASTRGTVGLLRL